MEDLFYKRYKVNVAATQKRQSGKVCLIVGILMLASVLILLPYRADYTSSISGEELHTGKAYYVENLQILDFKIEEDGKSIYCVAKFTDKNQTDWMISFCPLNNESLADQLRLAKRLGTMPDVTTSGYVYVDDIPSGASAFYSVRTHTTSAQENNHILKLHADYLCNASGNFTVEALMRPSLLKQAFVWGIIGTLLGAFLLIKYRAKKFQ